MVCDTKTSHTQHSLGTKKWETKKLRSHGICVVGHEPKVTDAHGKRFPCTEWHTSALDCKDSDHTPPSKIQSNSSHHSIQRLSNHRPASAKRIRKTYRESRACSTRGAFAGSFLVAMLPLLFCFLHSVGHHSGYGFP
jgi:hypothetical protein